MITAVVSPLRLLSTRAIITASVFQTRKQLQLSAATGPTFLSKNQKERNHSPTPAGRRKKMTTLLRRKASVLVCRHSTACLIPTRRLKSHYRRTYTYKQRIEMRQYWVNAATYNYSSDSRLKLISDCPSSSLDSQWALPCPPPPFHHHIPPWRSLSKINRSENGRNVHRLSIQSSKLFFVNKIK
jgi:hypothetical protein